MLRVDYQDEVCRFGAIGPLYASAWRQMPTLEQMAKLRDGFTRLLQRPDPIGILVIGLDANAGISITDGLRSDITSVFKSGADRVGPTAAVIEAKGFVAAFLRSLFAGIFLVARGRRHNRVFATRREAVTWLKQELGDATPPDLDESLRELTRGLE